MANFDGRDIAKLDWQAVARCDHGVGKLIGGMDQPHAPDNGGLRAEVDGLAAHIDVAVVNDGQNLRQGQAIGDELVLIDIDVIGLGLAAPSRDVDDARHGLEAALQHPILERLQIGDRIAGRADHAIAIDLAYRAFRGDLRLGVIG